MLLNLAPVVAVVKHFPPTRASEIDQSGPFGGWSDADFLAFENQINEQTRERYELRCVRMNEAESEDEADTIAAILEAISRGLPKLKAMCRNMEELDLLEQQRERAELLLPA